MLPTTAEKLQNFFGVFLQFQIGVDTEMMPEGYKKTVIRITPEGQAELKAYLEKTREKWITRSLSIAAIAISAVGIIWQILSSETP